MKTTRQTQNDRTPSGTARKLLRTSAELLLQRAPEWARIAETVDQRIEKITTHHLFIQTASTVINLNSHRKLLSKGLLTSCWKALELPNKRDQERGLHLIHELHHRLAELQEKVELLETTQKAPKATKPAKRGEAAQQVAPSSLQ